MMLRYVLCNLVSLTEVQVYILFSVKDSTAHITDGGDSVFQLHDIQPRMQVALIQ